MNSKISKIIRICLMLCLVVSICLFTVKVGADSGWDTSYDSGSSSSWSSSSSSSSDYSSGGGGGSSTIALIIWALLFFPCIIIAIVQAFKNKKSYKESIKEMSHNTIYKIDPNLNIKEFEDMIYSKFVSIQEDWMNFNYDGLRSNLTDELYNQYEMQLDTLKVKNEKNIMKDFKLLECYIKDINISNNIEYVDVILKVKFKDYVVNDNNKVIRGNKATTYEMTYKLTFERSVDNKVNKCPKCGAEVNKNINKCPYCRATIVKNSNEWVMCKKKLLKQLNTGLSRHDRFIIIFVIGFIAIIILMFLLFFLQNKPN